MDKENLSPRQQLNDRAKKLGYRLTMPMCFFLNKSGELIKCRDLLEVNQVLNQLESEQVK